MIPRILFRVDSTNTQELEIARQYFPVSLIRSEIPANSLVVGRYSCLPYYDELEKDLASNGSRLINTFRQHLYISTAAYINDLEGLTPRTWTDYTFSTADCQGPFVIKGCTNSKKWDWDNLMYCHDKRDASIKASRLIQDGLLTQQHILYREYIPLEKVEDEPLVGGIWPVNEWRLFCYHNTILSYGYYWSVIEQEKIASLHLSDEGLAFGQMIADKMGPKLPFYVIDIAEKEDGGWIVIELNSGCMSGLSENDPHKLYKNLRWMLGEGIV